jgi:ComF family protein
VLNQNNPNFFSVFLDLLFPRFDINYSNFQSYLQKKQISLKQTQIFTNNDCIANVFRFYSFRDDPINNLIKRAKYRGELAIAESFAESILNIYPTLNLSPDVISFVPPDPKRYTFRQYHFPQKIAQILSKKLQIPNLTLLKKIKHTKSQAVLNQEERLTNLENAFLALPNPQKFKNIVVIDDVLTTGTTAKECALALKKEYPKAKIQFLVIAS